MLLKDDVIVYIDSLSEFIKKNYPSIHISPRSLKQIINLSKAFCIIENKDYVTFQEIKDIAPYVFRHRINVVEKNETIQFIKNEILEKVKIPNEV